MKTYRISIPVDRGVKYQIFRYPAGESQVRVHIREFNKIETADVIEVTANITDGEIMELALLTSALKGLTSSAIWRLVLPYLPYSRADRRFVSGDCHGLNTFASLINSLGYSCVDTYDVHSKQARVEIPNLVVIPPDDYIQQVFDAIGYDDLTILLPDKGAQRYEEFVRTLGVDVLYGEKVRKITTGELVGFRVPNDLKRKVIIIDDICDGGGTFLGLAKAIKAKSEAHELYLYVTHGIFSRGFTDLLKYFKTIFTTTSFKSSVHPDPFDADRLVVLGGTHGV